MRILLVDDADMVRSMLESALVSHGHHVLAARNGNEALRLLEGASVDVVLTDIVMPEKEGLETIRDIRSLYPDLRVLAMSAARLVAGLDVLKAAEELGAACTLRKPFRIRELLAVLEDAPIAA